MNQPPALPNPAGRLMLGFVLTIAAFACLGVGFFIASL